MFNKSIGMCIDKKYSTEVVDRLGSMCISISLVNNGETNKNIYFCRMVVKRKNYDYVKMEIEKLIKEGVEIDREYTV